MAFTYFFRDSHTLDLAVQHMAPEVMGRSKIHVWDAGCAMGPEPYTLAILGVEHLGKFAFKNRGGITKHREMLSMILSPKLIVFLS